MKLSNGELANRIEVKSKYEHHDTPHPIAKTLSLLLVALGLVALCAGGLVLLRQVAWLVDTSDLAAGIGGGIFIIVFVLALTARK